ncbi:MAG TPA: hypothetical protein VFE62_29435 [Gemmataceae bacterium]|nr:hypothetical protein [Gemmataceae bacterium]
MPARTWSAFEARPFFWWNVDCKVQYRPSPQVAAVQHPSLKRASVRHTEAGVVEFRIGRLSGTTTIFCAENRSGRSANRDPCSSAASADEANSDLNTVHIDDSSLAFGIPFDAKAVSFRTLGLSGFFSVFVATHFVTHSCGYSDQKK